MKIIVQGPHIRSLIAEMSVRKASYIHFSPKTADDGLIFIIVPKEDHYPGTRLKAISCETRP